MYKFFSILLFYYSFSIYSYATEYTYAESNRLTQVTYDNGTVVSYEYDADGNLIKVSPTESASGGGDTGGGTDNGGGDTDSADNGTPETPEPEKKESGGGAFGWLTLLLIAGLFTLRSRARAKLKV
jgi:YD repeat-containing protein